MIALSNWLLCLTAPSAADLSNDLNPDNPSPNLNSVNITVEQVPKVVCCPTLSQDTARVNCSLGLKNQGWS